jgi:sulfite reductase alpha subunit-like flavoprotein
MVPRLQPRQFSIASALEAHPNRIQLLLAVFTLVTPFKRVRTGVCSSWLASLQPSRECFVPCWIKRGTFHPPADRQRPVLMVGPGTGIAPFRAMAEARAVQKLELEARTYELEPVAVAESAPAGDSNGSTSPSEPEPAPVSPLPHAYRPFLILFGNRNRAADFFYRDQWESFDRDEHAVHFHAVFSRDAADETGDASDDRMRYVQHVLERVHSASVARMLLAEEGCVMVAGSATGSMPKDVRAALGRVLQRHGPDGNGWSEQQAEEFLKAMDRKRRYLVEAW